MEQFNEENMSKQIKDSLDFLDANISVHTPDLTHFRQMVEQVEEKKYKRAKRETQVFIAVAVTILGVEVLTFNLSAVTFVILQPAAAVLVPACALLWQRLSRRRLSA